jgi:pimeloyl-ACP methyl ester carboxylesterase
MRLALTKLKWWICAVLIGICILSWTPLHRAAFSVRLTLSLKKLASGASGQDLAVIVTKAHREFDGHAYDALLYRPAKSSPASAVILLAGITKLGYEHPGIVALSRQLADEGLMVITPDIREFRDFQISVGAIDQILFWYKQVPNLEGGEKILRTGLAGISFSGTLALITAAKAEIRDKVGFVLAVGSYCNFTRCTKGWFASEPGALKSNHYPTRFYAKWIIMLAALNMLPESRDRAFLHSTLDSLLIEESVSPPDPDLTAEGARWYRLAIMRENQTDPELALEIEKYMVARVYTQLDPEEALGKIKCPVFLIHGAYDDLIPPGESMELNRKIANSRLLILPFITHTHPTDVPLSFGQKARAVSQILGFCYRFSQAVL